MITPTTVDEKVAAAQEPYAGHRDSWQTVAVEPRRRLAFRWHPYAVEPGVDYSAEPTTFVEFTLTESDGGVLLRIVARLCDIGPLGEASDYLTQLSRRWDPGDRTAAGLRRG